MNAAKVELQQKKFSDDGIPTISSIRKPLEIEQEFPHYKSSSSKGILHQ